MQLLLCAIVMQNIQLRHWVPLRFGVTCFWVAVVENGRGLLDHGTPKSALSQGSELIEWTDFFACWYKFRKANDNLVIIVWAWLKMGIKFTLYGTLRSGAFHTYDLINWADWLNNFWFDHESALYLWHLLSVRCSCTC